MKRCERKRRPYRGCKKTDQRSGRLLWHRMLAVLVAAVTILTGIELSGLEAVFAKETSGYQIDVSYSEGKAQAVLKGNTDSVGAGITLGELKDEEGNTFDPSEFETTVTENGTYTYILTYKETASQNGKQMDKEEKVTVTVDQIETKTSETSSVSAVNEAAASQQPAETLPISVLQAELRSLQQTRATDTAQLTVGMYAEELHSAQLENTDNQNTTTFSGGSLDAGAVPGFNQPIGNNTSSVPRQFTAARLITEGVSGMSGVQISGLYPVQSGNSFNWYYTIDVSSGEGGAYGDVSMGYLLDLDSGDEVRFYYSLSDSTSYNITFLPGGDYSFTLQTENRSVDGTGANPGITAKPGQKMIAEIDLASNNKSALMALYKGNNSWDDSENPLTKDQVVATYSMLRVEETDNSELTNKAGDTLAGSAELVSTTGNKLRYRIVFEMPAEHISIRMHAFAWPTNNVRSFALYINQGNQSYNRTRVPMANEDGGGTRFFNTFVSTTSDNLTVNSSDADLINGTGVANANKMTGGFSYGNYSGDTTGGFGSYQQPNGGTVGTYTHIDLPNWYYSSSGSSKTFDRATGKGNLEGVYELGEIGARNVYLNPGSMQQVEAAPGHFFVGKPVGFRLETTLVRTTSITPRAVSFQYLPSNLSVDIYQGSATASIESQEFERYLIDLSSIDVNQTKSFNLGGSGKVVVKCIVKQSKIQSGWTGFGGFSYARRYWNRDGFPAIAYDITVAGVTRPFKLVYDSESGAQAISKVSLAEGKIQAGSGTNGSSNNITGSYVLVTPEGNGSRPGSEYRTLTSNMLLQKKDMPSGGFEIGILPVEGYGQPTITISESGQMLAQNTDYTLRLSRVDEQGRYVYIVNPTSLQNGEIWNINIDATPVDFEVKYYDHNDSEISSGASLILRFGQLESALLNLYSKDTGNQHFDGYKITVSNTANISTEGVTITNAEGRDRWQPGEIMSVREIYQKAKAGQAFDTTTQRYYIRVEAEAVATPNRYINVGWTLYKQNQWFAAPGNSNAYDSSKFDNTTKGTIRGVVGETAYFMGLNSQFPDTDGVTYLLNEGKSTLSDEATTNNAEVGKFYYLRTAKAKIVIPDELQDTSAGGLSQDIQDEINRWNTDNTATLYTGADLNQIIDLSSIVLPETIGQGRQLQGWRIIKTRTSGNTEDFKVYNYEIKAATTGNGTSTLDLNELGRNEGDATAAGRDAWNAIFGTGTSAGTGEVVLIPYYDAGGKIVSNSGDDETTVLKQPSALDTYTNGNPDPSETGSVAMDAEFYYTGNREVALINNNLRFAVVKRELQRNATTGAVDTNAGESGMIAKVVAYGEINPANTTTPVTLQGAYNVNSKIGLGGLDGTGWEESPTESSFTLKLLLQDNITYQWDQEAVYSIHVWNNNNDANLYGKITDVNTGWGLDRNQSYNTTRQQDILAAFGTVSATEGASLTVPGISYKVNVRPKAVTRVGQTTSVTRGYTTQRDASEVRDDVTNIRYQYNGDGSVTVYPETKFTVKAQFQFDPQYPIVQYLQRSADGTVNLNGPTWDTSTFRVMILRRNGNGSNNSSGPKGAIADDAGFAGLTTDIQLWSNGYVNSDSGSGGVLPTADGNTPKMAAPVITHNSNNVITVEWTVQDLTNTNGNQLISWGNFDGNTLEIIGFSDGNEALASLQPGSILSGWTGSTTNRTMPTGDAYSSFPAERTYMDMTFKEAEYYMSIPQLIALNDKDGVEADSAGKTERIFFTASNGNNYITRNPASMPVVTAYAETGFTISTAGNPVKNLTVEVLDASGGELITNNSLVEGKTVAELGTLNANNNVTSLTFRLNTDASAAEWGENYRGQMMFYFDMRVRDGSTTRDEVTDGFPSGT